MKANHSNELKDVQRRLSPGIFGLVLGTPFRRQRSLKTAIALVVATASMLGGRALADKAPAAPTAPRYPIKLLPGEILLEGPLKRTVNYGQVTVDVKNVFDEAGRCLASPRGPIKIAIRDAKLLRGATEFGFSPDMVAQAEGPVISVAGRPGGKGKVFLARMLAREPKPPFTWPADSATTFLGSPIVGEIMYDGKKLPLLSASKSLTYTPTEEDLKKPLPPVTLGNAPSDFERLPGRTYTPCSIDWKLDFNATGNRERLLNDMKGWDVGALMIFLPANFFQTQYILESQITYGGKPFIPEAVYQDPENGNYFGILRVKGKQELLNNPLELTAKFIDSNLKPESLAQLAAKSDAELSVVIQETTGPTGKFRGEPRALSALIKSVDKEAVEKNLIPAVDTHLTDPQKLLQIVTQFDKVTEYGEAPLKKGDGLIKRDVCEPLSMLYNMGANGVGLSSWLNGGYAGGSMLHSTATTYITVGGKPIAVRLDCSLQNPSYDPLAMLARSCNRPMFRHGQGTRGTIELFNQSWICGVGSPVHVIYVPKECSGEELVTATAWGADTVDLVRLPQ